MYPKAAVEQALDDLEDEGDELTPADDDVDIADEEAEAAIAETFTRVGRPRTRPVPKSQQPDGVVSWWTTPEAQQDFAQAARRRDAEGRTDKEWTKRTQRERFPR